MRRSGWIRKGKSDIQLLSDVFPVLGMYQVEKGLVKNVRLQDILYLLEVGTNLMESQEVFDILRGVVDVPIVVDYQYETSESFQCHRFKL